MSEPDKPETLRLFVAITVPKEIKARIEAAQQSLRAAVPEQGVRWASGEQFHLTLRFLGRVEASRLDDLTNTLRAACAGFGPLHLRVQGIGFFPRPRAPRVVWVGVTDDQDRLSSLQRAVQLATNEFTQEEPDERFTGHITLGRVKQIRSREAEALGDAGRQLEQTFLGDWVAKEVELIRSQLSTRGAQYTALAAAAL